MNATGTRPGPAQVFETTLAELKRWREATAEALGAFRRWAVQGRLIDEQAAARLAHLERRLAAERLTIAFAGEFGRGKSELINALFFAELGAKLLPGGARCPTEIAWDPARPPSIRLLPIETRAGGRALRECLDDPAAWWEVKLDPSQPEALAATCEVLSQAKEMDAAQAASLGFAAESVGPLLNVARWRYALINFPHALLAAGVTLLDTADQRTLASEPELTFHRVPDAAAIVFIVSAQAGISQGDRQLWLDHIAPVAGIAETCFVVLNKIDELRGGAKVEAEVLAQIDRQVKAAAEALGVPPTRIFPLSARQAFAAKLQGDRDGILKSRLYRLEQALSRGMVHQRRLDHATAVRAEARGVFAEIGSLITSRLGFARQQLEELAALQGKNQKLVEALARKTGVERGRLEQARAAMTTLRASHHRLADELGRLLDPGEARSAALRARAAVASSAFSKDIGAALDAFFRELRDRIERAVAVIGEAKGLMATMGRKFSQDYKIAVVETADFATGRFLAELGRLEEHCAREFKGRSSLIIRGQKALGAQFFDTVASNAIHVFEIADRETRTWMAGFIRPLEAQINAYQEQSNTRIEGMGRIQDAEGDLIARLEELRRLAVDVEAQRGEWDAHHKRVMALLEAERAPSLA